MVRLIVVTGRPKVDPARQRRYRIRTMPVPDHSYTATLAEREAMERYARGWVYDRASREWVDDRASGPLPGPLAWKDQVEKYAAAQGFTVSFTVQENHQDMSTIYRWERSR